MHDKTKLCHIGLSPQEHHGIVNPPVYHTSTVLFPDVETLERRVQDPFSGVFYGRYGTPTTFALEQTITVLEQGAQTTLVNSGLAAIALALTSFTASGDHILIADTVYGPTRSFATSVLRRFGVETTFFDPYIGSALSTLIKPNTTVVFLESPGSLTFEIQDVPAIVSAVRRCEKPCDKKIVILIDNTWATPLFFKPLTLGVNVSLHSATKYLSGHSDTMFGVLTADAEHAPILKRNATHFGISVSPDDVYLCLRGIRSLAVRLRQHQENALQLSEYLAQRPEVARILSPAHSTHPTHHLWQRDFTGSSGLFSIVLKPCPRKAVSVLLNSLKLFGIGFSWGGFESLAVPVQPQKFRTAVPWEDPGTVIRFHTGLEDITDLIQDLDQGFHKFHTSL